MMFAVRYGLPGVLIAVGVAFLVIRRDGTGVEAFSLAVGAGLAILLFNVFFRIGASGDTERRAEEDAREFFSRHGHWPDEPPPE